MKPNWPLLAGLRFFLATIVVFVHSTYLVSASSPMAKVGNSLGGFAAVFGFLLISGFSIAHSLKQEEGFYGRRLERLAPTYFLCLLFCGLVYLLYFRFTTPTTAHWPGLPKGSLSWVAAFIMMGGVLAAPWPLMAPAWSLGAEVCYYVVAPWLKKVKAPVLLGMTLVSIALYVYTGLHQVKDYSKSPGLLTVACLFWPWLAGWIFYKYRENKLVWLALIATVAVFAFGSGHSADGNPLVVAIVGAALLAGQYFSFPPMLSRGLNYLGDLSFPLYLAHYPGIYFAKFLVVKHLLPDRAMIIVAASYACAAVITFLVHLWAVSKAASKKKEAMGKLALERA